MSGGRLPKRIVFETLRVQCGDDGVVMKANGSVAYRAASSIAGDWKVTALEAEVSVETVTEGGRRFMAVWRKEGENTV